MLPVVGFLLLDCRQAVEVALDALLEVVDIGTNDLQLRLSARTLTASATFGPDTR